MVMSGAERAAAYRYAGRLETTITKLQKLLSEPPKKYEEDFRQLPNYMPLEEALFDCVATMLGAEWVFEEDGKDLAVKFVISMEGEPEIPPDAIVTFNPETFDRMLDYERYKLSESPQSYEQTTLGDFCQQAFGTAQSDGWVYVKESESGEAGELYIPVWEHQKDAEGGDSVSLISNDVYVDEAGNADAVQIDALEKFNRVVSGELDAYIVWLKAVDPMAEQPVAESINSFYVTSCELGLDGENCWTAKLGPILPINMG